MINTTDGTCTTNRAYLCGEAADNLRLSHKTYGEAFYTFSFTVARNSGYEDKVTVMASERILNGFTVCSGLRLSVEGQIRTYNEDENGRNKLNIVVFARDIKLADEEADKNEVYLEGFLCKKPLLRTSPLGRKICDLMLAVNRMYNKSDYIPCIAWGRSAVYSSTLDVGEKIILKGRIQSRQYRKKTEYGTVLEKTAFEVSVLQLESA
ncbi:MAG: single-stranded DNA-binding protein [Emergencia sp.]|nr:single-stranded DNA-binding protein [Emergencia sp.]